MLHEVLLALLGHTGDVITPTKEGGFCVDPSMPFLHPSERTMIDRVCVVGAAFASVQNFVQSQRRWKSRQGRTSVRQRQSGRPGLYVLALCSGLDAEMRAYRETVVAAERDVLSSPDLTLAHLVHAIQCHEESMPALRLLIQEVDNRKLRGGQLLNYVHQCSLLSGVPQVQKSMQRLMYHCHIVFTKQLVAWMVHGIAGDSHGEFFVKRGDNNSRGGGGSEASGVGGGAALVPSDPTQIQSQGRLQFSDWTTCFVLDLVNLPTYISLPLAQQILFVGKATQVLQLSNKHVLLDSLGAIGAAHSAGQDGAGADVPLSPGGGGKGGGSPLPSKHDPMVFAADVCALARAAALDVFLLAQLVAEEKRVTGRHLWHMMVHSARLASLCESLFSFHLLARGDLWDVFVVDSSAMMAVPPTNNAEGDVNVVLQRCGMKVLVDGHETSSFSKIKLRLPQHAAADGGGGGGGGVGWKDLTMSMELEWPLNLVVTNASLARYNGLFSFLLNIKRVQIDLQQAFTLCKGGSGLASEERVLKWRENDSFGGHGHHAFGAPVSSQALHLRTNMAFLVDNVQYYLMVDVLGAQYALLQSRVAGSKDFEALKTAHDVFLSTLEAQSLINIQVVERALDDIFSLCRRFCSELRRLTDAQAAAGAAALPPEDGPPLITKLAKDYERASCFLFTILQSFQNKQAAPHLSQLLLRIDYNRHFSKAAARIGGSQLATSSQALHELRV